MESPGFAKLNTLGTHLSRVVSAFISSQRTKFSKINELFLNLLGPGEVSVCGQPMTASHLGICPDAPQMLRINRGDFSGIKNIFKQGRSRQADNSQACLQPCVALMARWEGLPRELGRADLDRHPYQMLSGIKWLVNVTRLCCEYDGWSSSSHPVTPKNRSCSLRSSASISNP
uniref:uncharacterized protein LOC118552412 isoform X2 n=1 Tax=Halichoerus grypus TaxID=9711 RepID=UPI0016598766|nr:uncharacterized protein LOC118552412 isoform X2 [Halichoerus grypus]